MPGLEQQLSVCVAYLRDRVGRLASGMNGWLVVSLPTLENPQRPRFFHGNWSHSGQKMGKNEDSSPKQIGYHQQSRGDTLKTKMELLNLVAYKRHMIFQPFRVKTGSFQRFFRLPLYRQCGGRSSHSPIQNAKMPVGPQGIEGTSNNKYGTEKTYSLVKGKWICGNCLP